MLQRALQCRNEATMETCAACGHHIQMACGYQLRTIDNLDPVCPDCAGKHAPSLAALLNLGRAAERISRIGRHSVFPPLSALLDLASAAEKYTGAVSPARRNAG